MDSNSKIIKSGLTSEEQIQDAITSLKEVIKERLIANQMELKKIVQQAQSLLNKATGQKKVAFVNNGGGTKKAPSVYTLDENQEKGRLLYQVYELINKCIVIITERDPINYAIYYEYDGKLYRKSESILENHIRYNEHNDDIRFYISKAEMLKLIQEEEEFSKALGEHYKDFSTLVYKCQESHNVSLTWINKGHELEAFERHLQTTDSQSLTQKVYSFNHEWKLDEIWQYISDAVNNRPWYTGGDVGNIQVKNITRGAVRVSTVTSLRNILNLISSTLSVDMNSAAFDSQIYSIIKELFNKEDLNMEGYSNEIDAAITETLKSLIANSGKTQIDLT